MEINLVPLTFKKTIKAVKTVSIMIEILTILLLIGMGLAGLFQDLTTALLFSFGLLLVTTPLLIPGFLYEKVSQSTAVFSSDRILILNKKGCCWREIPYDSITDVRIEEIAGFFYGHDKEQFRHKYICFFMNGETEIPKVSFAKLFAEKNFMIISYQEEIFDSFKHIYSLNNFFSINKEGANEISTKRLSVF